MIIRIWGHMPFYKQVSEMLYTNQSQWYKSTGIKFILQYFSLSAKNHLSRMQQDYIIFPKFDWGKGKNSRLTHCEATDIITNYYPMDLRKEFKTIFQYSIGFEPELPADASKVVDKLIESIKRELKQKLGLICYKGRMLWGNIKADLALIINTTIEVKGEKQSYEAILKPADKATLTIEDFIARDPENLARLSQILNINIKNSLRKIGYRELDKGRYYSAQEFGIDQIKQAGLSVWRGYQVTVAPMGGRLFLKVDVCSRVLRMESFLQTLKNTKKIKDKQFINQNFKDVSVITRYGNHHIYRIAQIDYSMTPRSTFMNYKSQEMRSFIDYYRITYQCTIQDPDQPLIKIIVKNCQKEQVQYLVPELVCMTGLTDHQRNDFQVMKAVAEWTKLRVDERVTETNKVVRMLNKNSDKQLMFQIEEKAHELQASIASSPMIEVGKKKIIQPDKGEINLRDQLLDPIHLKDYFFVYSSRGDRDDQDADATYDFLHKASRAYGIKLNQPFWVDIKCNRDERLTANDWIDSIESQLQKGKPEFVILYFSNEEKNDKQLYQKLKTHLIHKLQLNSQVITKKTLSSTAKGGMSKASKILLQINDKMGHPLYKIQKQHDFWAKNSIAIGSLASSAGPKGLVVSFVGTRNNDLTQHFSDFTKIAVKEKIPDEVITNFLSGWLREYFKTEGKKLPDVLVLYRQGLNEVQAAKILNDELNVMDKVFEEVSSKAKIPGWKPKLIYLLVNQKAGTRVYDKDQRNGRLSNPLPGTIIGSEMSKDGSYEYLMASAQTTEGTCNMVQYKVAYDSSNQEVPDQALKILTYEQCYNYPNWMGSIRFPATLQKANKLAKFVSSQGEGKIEKGNPLKALDYYI